MRGQMKKFPDPGAGSASKNLSIVTLKTVSKLWDVHPGSRTKSDPAS